MNCAICGKKLRKHNTIGTCRKHRGKSPIRRQYEKDWQEDHKEQYQAAKNKWIRENPEYYADYLKDPCNHIAHNLRVRIRQAVQTGSAIENLGCSIEFFKAYLEAKFTPGMSWENYGEWDIDHIQPLISFDLTDPEQLAKACHYTNMQPLWEAENSRKHAKLDYVPKSA